MSGAGSSTSSRAGRGQHTHAAAAHHNPRAWGSGGAAAASAGVGGGASSASGGGGDDSSSSGGGAGIVRGDGIGGGVSGALNARRDGRDDDAVHVLVLGDSGVGKTALIRALVSEHFSEDLPEVMETVIIPRDTAFTRDLQVTDTSADIARESHRNEELRAAVASTDVIIMVYAVDEPQTFESVGNLWLPKIENYAEAHAPGGRVPVVLVGAKADKDERNEGRNEAFVDMMQPLLVDFNCVELAMECSAKTLIKSVIEVFHHATRVVDYPIPPIVDVRSQQPTVALRRALRRIFRLFDRNHDSYLSLSELALFQEVCFGMPLPEEDMSTLLEVLSNEDPQGTTDLGISEDTFVRMVVMFVSASRPEHVWQVLRHFHYDNRLALTVPDAQFVVPHKRDQVVSLNADGKRFITDLYQQFTSRDNRMDEAALRALFSACPEVLVPGGTHPWGDSFPRCTLTTTDADGSGRDVLTLDGWKAQWAMSLMLDERRALQVLYGLGFAKIVEGGRGALHTLDLHTANAVQLSTCRSDERRGRVRPQRATIRAFVVGSKGCGKSTLVASFLRRQVRGRSGGAIAPTVSQAHSVCKAAHVATHGSTGSAGASSGDSGSGSSSRGGGGDDSTVVPEYLVLTEFPERDVDVALRDAETDADVLLLCFDASSLESLDYVKHLHDRPEYPWQVPCRYIACKWDLVVGSAAAGGGVAGAGAGASAGAGAGDRHVYDISAQHTQSLELDAPARVCPYDDDGRTGRALLAEITGLALDGHESLPVNDEMRANARWWRNVTRAGITTAVVTALGIGWYLWSGRSGGSSKSDARTSGSGSATGDAASAAR